ncbi:MAG: hypothetical protein HZA77_08125 [Candidatus Schekmanbacteria bacterium]|nr:hypothetical protein [Candidatus Schekmanbacteria bacterium]
MLILQQRIQRFSLLFSILFIFISLCISSTVHGSGLTSPVTQKVYGGRINWIDAAPISSTTTRIFISTESANSMFYADVDHSVITPTYSAFQPVPDMDSDDGYGKSITSFAADGNSGYLFSINDGKLLSCSTTAGTINTIVDSNAQSVTVYNSMLFYLVMEGNIKLHFGSIAGNGTFTESVSSPIDVGSGGAPAGVRLLVNPATSLVYIFQPGTSPKIYESSETYSSLTSGSTFSMLPVVDLGSERDYRAFGIGPDGRIFVGAQESVEPAQTKFIAYTDDHGATWHSVFTGIGGTSGSNIAAGGTADAYYVYFGSAVNTNKGEDGSWHAMPNGGTSETHSNDGAVFADPNNSNVIYLTTDLGIGASINSGVDLIEIDDGVEAVQVNDFDMNSDKTIGWLASKAGIRQVKDYNASSPTWTTFFPNNDGSPYYSIAMDKSDTSGGTAYAGNVRLYRTSDAGSTWSMIFSTEETAYSGTFNYNSRVASVAIHPDNPDVVVVGINSSSSGVKGGILITQDASSVDPSWAMVDTGVYNAEVKDLLIVSDSGITTTIYAGCEYVNDGVTSSYGVKTINYDVPSGISTFSNDMVSSETETNITNFGANSLAINSNGDVYAAGGNSTNEPRIYVMAVGTTTWKMMNTDGLPLNRSATAVTIGKDSSDNETPYIAVGEDIYYYDGASWVLGYEYPVGTDINVLYWDDLLVGTGTGLYAQTTEQTDLPDLKAGSIKVSSKVKRKITSKVRAVVKNIGTAAAASKVSFYLSSNNSDADMDNDTLLATKSIGSISANKSKTVVLKWKPAKNLKPGKYYLKAVCDSASSIEEMSENNNTVVSNKITVK